MSWSTRIFLAHSHCFFLLIFKTENQRKLSPGKRKKSSETQISSSNWELEGGSHDSSMSEDDEDIDADGSTL